MTRFLLDAAAFFAAQGVRVERIMTDQGSTFRWSRSFRGALQQLGAGHVLLGLNVEVRAVGLKAMREKRGLTQRKLARDLGISRSYVPAIEANTRQAGPKLQPADVECAFEELFETVFV